MSTSETTHFSSIAKRLEAQGFKKTGIARAVIELVQAYLGISEPSPRIKDLLSSTNTGANSVMQVSSGESLGKNALNDSHTEIPKTGTNG